MVTKPKQASGPDWADVTGLIMMLRRDLNLSVSFVVRPRVAAGICNGFVIETVLLPCTPAECIWEPHIPMVVEREWNPRLGKEMAAAIWTELFLVYSYDLPSEWPTRSIVTQLPLAGA